MCSDISYLRSQSIPSSDRHVVYTSAPRFPILSRPLSPPPEGYTFYDHNFSLPPSPDKKKYIDEWRNEAAGSGELVEGSNPNVEERPKFKP